MWRRFRRFFGNCENGRRMGEPRTLDRVRIRHSVRIISVRMDRLGMYKLADMGITPGVVVEIQEKAPFGGPLLIRVRGSVLALRPHEASRIEVQAEV